MNDCSMGWTHGSAMPLARRGLEGASHYVPRGGHELSPMTNETRCGRKSMIDHCGGSDRTRSHSRPLEKYMGV